MIERSDITLKTQVINFKTREQLRHAFFKQDFPCIRAEELNIKKLVEIEELLNGEVLEEWRRCIAECLLMLTCEGWNIPLELLNKFGLISPFSNSVSLRQALELNRAMAVIILHVKDSGEGELAHIWVTGPVSESSCLLHESHRIPDDCSVFSVSNGTFEGNSWQAGFCLAYQAIKHKNISLKKNLFRKWAATGRVEGDLAAMDAGILPVEIGNKLNTDSEFLFLVPRQNDNTFSIKRNIHYCGTVSEAIMIIEKKGIREIEPITFPKGPVEIHSIVSEQYYSTLAVALIFSPAKLVLWHSDSEEKSVRPAKIVREVLQELIEKGMIGKGEIVLRDMDSRYASKAAEDLRKYFEEYPSNNQLFFNIGQGNHLMRFAQQLIGIEKQAIFLYKNFDEHDPCKLTCLKLQQDGSWGTYILEGHEPDCLNLKNISNIKNWQAHTRKTIIDALTNA